MYPIEKLTHGLIIVMTCGAALSPPAATQERACPYIRCFLSIQLDPPRVVQGAAATPIARFGAFAPRIDLLANGSDSTRHHYEAFRAAYNRGSALALIGDGAMIAGGIVVLVHPNENFHPTANVTTGLGITVGGFLLSLLAVVPHHQAVRHLEQSLAFYNRTLPDGP